MRLDYSIHYHPWQEARWCADRHGVGEGAESSTSWSRSSRKILCVSRPGLNFWDFKTLPPPAPQGCTSSNQVTPTLTKPHLPIVPLYMSLWGPFSFKWSLHGFLTCFVWPFPPPSLSPFFLIPISLCWSFSLPTAPSPFSLFDALLP